MTLRPFALICLVFSMLLTHGLAAQSPAFRHIDVADGLASATFYDVFQDQKGYVWFCSEAGVTRFDGLYLEHFTMDDGLADNEVFGLYQDRQGRIWARAFNGQLSYFQGGYHYNQSDLPALAGLATPDWITHIHEDAAGHLYFAQRSSGFSVLLAGGDRLQCDAAMLRTLWEGYHTTNALPPPSSPPQVLGFQSIDDTTTRIFTTLGTMALVPATGNLQVVQHFSREISQVHFVGQGRVLATQQQAPLTVLAYTRGDFVPFYTHPRATAKTIIPLQLDAQGTLLLGTLGDGLFRIDTRAAAPRITQQYLAGKAVSNAMTDNEGNLWVTTLGDGVYLLPSNAVLTYTQVHGLSSNDLYAITGNARGDIYVGNARGDIDHLRPDGRIAPLFPYQSAATAYNRINDLWADGQGRIWAGSDQRLTLEGRTLDPRIRSAKMLAPSPGGGLYVATGKGVYAVTPFGESQEIWNRRATAVLPISDSAAWIGSNAGLYRYAHGQGVVPFGEGEPALRGRISDIAYANAGILCLCTSNGVVLLRDTLLQHLTQRDGLAGNVCRDLFIQPDDQSIWMATQAGISHFKVNARDLSLDFLANYSKSENLASNDIRRLYVDERRVWMATSEGLSYFDLLDRRASTVPPPIYITSVRIWEGDTTLHDAYHLPHHRNNIHIGYTGISFQSGARLRYQYRMEGIDTEWITTYVPEVQYPDLAPGSYTFQVRALHADGTPSTSPATVRFVIHPPWWRTWWFYVLATLTGGGLTALVVGYIVRNRRQKEQLSRQIVESEQMALRAQMNPHFVFNALNSIQHFITMEDELSANYYLTRFSKLMRQVLENSKHSFITLQEEIDTLQLYLELEKLRFDSKFSYRIDLAPDVNDYDTEIPSMIIQPFLENAIWHGLMPKQGEALLTLTFEVEEDGLRCTIEDNGIGRSAAAAHQQGRDKKHKSTGIANTVKRLSLLSKVKDERKLMQIIDLYDDSGQPRGTRVVLRIPTRR